MHAIHLLGRQEEMENYILNFAASWLIHLDFTHQGGWRNNEKLAICQISVGKKIVCFHWCHVGLLYLKQF